MYTIKKVIDIEKNYQLMVNIIKAMLEDEREIIANLANISSVVNTCVDRINWVGFYLVKNGALVLGPFQGMPACIKIKLGDGICGMAANEKRVVVAGNVHEFPTHIACDSKTNSEIVIPIYKNSEVFGVLDLDSPEYDRFTELEVKYLTQIGELISEFIDREGEGNEDI